MSLRRFDTAELAAAALRGGSAAARSLALAAVTSTVASVALALFPRRRSGSCCAADGRRSSACAAGCSARRNRCRTRTRSRARRWRSRRAAHRRGGPRVPRHAQQRRPRRPLAPRRGGGGGRRRRCSTPTRGTSTRCVRLAERLLRRPSSASSVNSLGARRPPARAPAPARRARARPRRIPARARARAPSAHRFVDARRRAPSQEANDLALRLARAHTARRGRLGAYTATRRRRLRSRRSSSTRAPGRPPHVHKACCPTCERAAAPIRAARPAHAFRATTRARVPLARYRGAHARRLDAAAEYANDVAAACARAGRPRRRLRRVDERGGRGLPATCCVRTRARRGHRLRRRRGAGRLRAPRRALLGLRAAGCGARRRHDGSPATASRSPPSSAAPRSPRRSTTGWHFNTFGGNPVACAGLAVLDVPTRGLQWRAAAVGAHLRRRLQQLADDPSAGRLLGEVRGAGSSSASSSSATVRRASRRPPRRRSCAPA